MSTHSHPHGHPAHPTQSAQHPAVAPAAPIYTQLNWSFPFTPVGEDDATDPMTYMKALAKAEDGFFPIGTSGMWHGGIHFDQGTAAMLKQDGGVRAIADGEVVAYRMDSKYPEQLYEDGRHALYSTSFVLIRHQLQLPPTPPKQDAATTQTPSVQTNAAHPASTPQQSASSTATPGAPSAPKPNPDETLTFFSLYMHLMDWHSYQAQQKQTSGASTPSNTMAYWEGDKYYRVGDKSKDQQEVPKPKASESSPAGSTSNDVLGDFINAGFVLPQQTVGEKTADNAPTPVPIKGIRIRDLPNGKVIGLLPKGSELTISDTDPQHPGWGKIKSIKSGEAVAAVVGKAVSEHAQWSWVYVNELDVVVDPKPLDAVVVLKQPYKVKAGEVVGQLGHYLRYTDAKLLKAQATRQLLHLEVFAGSELKPFIEKSQARAKELTPTKSFLEISAGALLVTEISDPDKSLSHSQGGLTLVPVSTSTKSRWIKVQPKTMPAAATGTNPPHSGQANAHPHAHHPATLTNFGSPVWVDAKIANTTTTDVVKAWSSFPLSLSKAKGPGADFRDVFRRTDLNQAEAENIAIDDKGCHWWNIAIGSKDGSIRRGWVCEEDHPLTRWCGPWEWPGFDLVDNSGMKPVDMIKRYIYATDQFLPGEEKSEFEPSALKVNAGDMIVKLEKAIDANHDGKVTAHEIQHAQEIPWVAEALTHLVVRYESEWGGGLGKWQDLSPLMKKLLWLWQAEIERIGNLQWWEQISNVDGFPKTTTVWHFHPIGLVANFINSAGGDQILTLTAKDVLDLKKTLQTEWVQFAGDMQAKGIVDTILNRVASGRFVPDSQFGSTVSAVVNQYNQFSDINGPIARNQHHRSSVEQIPVSLVSQRVNDLVDSYLRDRANGEPSCVGTNLNYANPNYSDAVNLAWINALSGPRYGVGSAMHYHGTTPGLEPYRPQPFSIALIGGE